MVFKKESSARPSFNLGHVGRYVRIPPVEFQTSLLMEELIQVEDAQGN